MKYTKEQAQQILKSIPFKPATYCTLNGNGVVKRIVIHCVESPEVSSAAENNLDYFSSRESSKTSCHYFADNDSIGQSVRERDKAWHCGYNSNSIGIELAGKSAQSRAEWLDSYSRATLENASLVCADLCVRHKISPRNITNEELARGVSGIVTHAQMSQVFHGSDHTDPGPGFPMDVFMAFVQDYYAMLSGAQPAQSAPKTTQSQATQTPSKPKLIPLKPLLVDGDLGPATVRRLQFYLGAYQDGLLGPATTKALQQRLNAKLGTHLAVDGDLGPATTKALQRYVGAYVDGDFGPATTKALQSKLNNGTF